MAVAKPGAIPVGRRCLVQSLKVAVIIIDQVNEWIGKTIAWLALFMVLLEFTVVVLRYVFGVGFVMMQEAIVYMHAAVFMGAAGYTLCHNGHVRCDIFYSRASPRQKARIDLFGVLVFLLPMCLLVARMSWPYVAAAWAVREGSPEGSLGIPGVYLLKTVILVFAGLLGLQGIALGVRSLLILAGIKGDSVAGEGPGGRAV
jgi:TRAP-type mannitol/chloroaromatic compound transport system permease small subunit